MKIIQTVLLTGALSAGSVLADSRAPQHIGVGSGALLGGLIAGPVGLAVGATFGNFLGLDRMQAQELAQVQDQRATLQAQVNQRRQELAALERQIQSQQQTLVALKTLVQEVPMALLFDTQSAQLADQYVPTLQALADAARDLPELRILLEGHADQRGSAETNQALSEARAAVVGDELVNQGVPAVAVSWKGHGESAASGQNARDRRVQVTLQFPESESSLYSAK